MVYKIGNIADMKNLPPVEKNFEIFLTNCAKSLTAVYGTDRNVDHDDGGYLLYIEKDTPHDEIKKYFEYWEKVSDSAATVKAHESAVLETFGADLGGYAHFFMIGKLFSEPSLIEI